jgi:hypothetical protein
MLTALWPATLGYFFSQMMADVFTPQQIETARQYVIDNTIPRAPVPALRVGRTPYGVLPVTSLRRYATEATFLAGSFELRWWIFFCVSGQVGWQVHRARRTCRTPAILTRNLRKCWAWTQVP